MSIEFVETKLAAGEVEGDLTGHRVCLPILMRRGIELRKRRVEIARRLLWAAVYVVGVLAGILAVSAQGGPR